MARRKLFLHIGPSDPGTAFLAEALELQRSELATLGIHVPVGVLNAKWHEIEDQVWRHKGTTLLSMPQLARAQEDAVGLRLTGLRDIDLHLVVLVRDLPSQVYAGWQDGLQHGSTTSLRKYAARVLDPRRGHWQAEEFWAGRDLTAFLPRWTRTLHADQVHVVATKPDADAVWRAFLGQGGVGDLARPDVLVPPVLSADLDPGRILDITTGWSKLIAERGFDQTGSLISGSLETGQVADQESRDEALGELLTATTHEIERLSAEVAALRRENDRLDRKRRKHKRRLAELAAAR